MAIPASRSQLLAAIDEAYSRLERDLDGVPADRVREPVLPGHVQGTTMSPADLVAYLIGWNRQVLLWHERRAAGLPDEFPAAGVSWSELGVLARRFYGEHRDDTWTALRACLDDAKHRIVELVQAHSDEELYGSPWYGTYTLGRMISLNTSSPYRNASGRIRRWLRTL